MMKTIGISIIIVLTISFESCKKEPVSISSILRANQWRKTEVVICNSNNEPEEYLFLFDSAEDCEKNSFIEFKGRENNYGFFLEKNGCTNSGTSTYTWEIRDNRLIIRDKISNTVSDRAIFFFSYNRFILQKDTLIYEEVKIIKETYSAF